MSNQEHLALVRQGPEALNTWVYQHYHVKLDLAAANLAGIDLREAELYGANLAGANLRKADLRGADMRHATLHKVDLVEANLGWTTLYQADLTEANLRRARLQGADLRKANLSHAQLAAAFLRDANLRETNFSDAELCGANLTCAVAVGTDFSSADLTGARIYGIAAWRPILIGACQENLIITREDEPTVTVDDLEVAQFIYLLLDNPKIRQVIDTVTSKAVLILGRFTDERKAVLEALRYELRQHDCAPILFDFDKPASRNLTETVDTLANLASFVIADLTDPRSIPQELQRIIPGHPSLPVQPIILSSQDAYAMFGDMLDYPWVLAPFRYDTLAQLLVALPEAVIQPALERAKALKQRRAAIQSRLQEPIVQNTAHVANSERNAQ